MKRNYFPGRGGTQGKRGNRVLGLFLGVALCWFGCVPATASADDGAIRLPVVMYHHISTYPDQWNDYVISPEEFAGDMDYLSANGWHSVSVRELLAWREGTFVLPENPFLLTFDDGFESTMAYAEPVVAAHGFTGVVAVIGAVCEKFSQCGEHDPEWSNLSWEDAAAMARRGSWEIQCHTWDMHTLHPRCGCGKIKWEDSARYSAILTADLSRFLGECEKRELPIVPAIAYPYGSYGPETTAVVKSLGFQAAFTCNEEINLLQGDPEELFHLGRFNRPHGVTSEAFFAQWDDN